MCAAGRGVQNNYLVDELVIGVQTPAVYRTSEIGDGERKKKSNGTSDSDTVNSHFRASVWSENPSHAIQFRQVLIIIWNMAQSDLKCHVNKTTNAHT